MEISCTENVRSILLEIYSMRVVQIDKQWITKSSDYFYFHPFRVEGQNAPINKFHNDCSIRVCLESSQIGMILFRNKIVLVVKLNRICLLLFVCQKTFYFLILLTIRTKYFELVWNKSFSFIFKSDCIRDGFHVELFNCVQGVFLFITQCWRVKQPKTNWIKQKISFTCEPRINVIDFEE